MWDDSGDELVLDEGDRIVGLSCSLLDRDA